MEFFTLDVMSCACYCFTLNNPTVDEESELQVSHPEVSYIVYGHERGESGTPHLQGYLELSKRMSIRQIKKLFSCERIHLENRRGTQEQAIAYCLKEAGEKYERGEKKTSGRPKAASAKIKNKLLEFKSDVKTSLAGFSNHPDCSFQLLKHAKEYLALNESPRKRTDPLTVLWFHGPTGSGKTRKAFDMAESKNQEVFIKSGSYKWFDGYDGHQFVIFDDFRDCQCEFGWLLRLLDIYPLRVEIKGGTRQWKPSTIVVTSPMPPEETYKNMQATDRYDKIGQLLRRITKVEFIEKYDPEVEVANATSEPPQTPQGGLKRDRNNIAELDYSPAVWRSYYPVTQDHSPLDLPRIQIPLGDSQSPRPIHSPTQEWEHLPDSE